MKLEQLKQITAAFICTLIMIGGAANFAAAQQTVQNDKLTTEIDKAIRAAYDAYARRDAAMLDNVFATDGFLYDTSGYMSAADLRKVLSGFFQSPQAAKSKLSYEIKNLKVTGASADTAVANYEMLRRIENEKGEKTEVREQITDIFVRRDGRWLLFAEHVSILPKIVAPVSEGMPNGWRLTPAGNNAAKYALTVDTAVKHGGQASANIKAMCADNGTDWASLAQSIRADEYRGKRVRLTGWLKTEGVHKAGLWMRIDGNKRQLGFDNMDNRAVTGTSDWKQYSVVLDVPTEAVNIYFGTLVEGAGSVWADDLKIEVVGSDVASTNQMTAEEMKQECAPCQVSKPDANKKPVNLDFEAGAVGKMN